MEKILEAMEKLLEEYEELDDDFLQEEPPSEKQAELLNQRMMEIALELTYMLLNKRRKIRSDTIKKQIQEMKKDLDYEL